jgi:hypothetical protein
MLKVTVWYFLSDIHRVMTVLILFVLVLVMFEELFWNSLYMCLLPLLCPCLELCLECWSCTVVLAQASSNSICFHLNKQFSCSLCICSMLWASTQFDVSSWRVCWKIVSRHLLHWVWNQEAQYNNGQKDFSWQRFVLLILLVSFNEVV